MSRRGRALRVIPVIDLMGGEVVRGVGGRRNEYRPIVSQLVADPSPLAVAKAFISRFHLRECYLADLDAIRGADPDWATYERLIALDLDLWVDAGIADLRRAKYLADFQSGGVPLAGIVAGLETLSSPELLPGLLSAIGPDRLVFSLDLMQGQPLSAPAVWKSTPPLEIALAALDMGVRRLMVLDLADVGTNQGCRTIELCRAIRDRRPDIELTAGGGVRGPDDLRVLADAGCDSALVASALHDGRIEKGLRPEA